jgi:hypothetical protein
MCRHFTACAAARLAPQYGCGLSGPTGYSPRESGKLHSKVRRPVQIEPGLRPKSPENGNYSMNGRRLSAVSAGNAGNWESGDRLPIAKAGHWRAFLRWVEAEPRPARLPGCPRRIRTRTFPIRKSPLKCRANFPSFQPNSRSETSDCRLHHPVRIELALSLPSPQNGNRQYHGGTDRHLGRSMHVRPTSQSRHRSDRWRCPLWANSGSLFPSTLYWCSNRIHSCRPFGVLATLTSSTLIF